VHYRVRVSVPCVSRLPPVSFSGYRVGVIVCCGMTDATSFGRVCALYGTLCRQ
jgi:hypothetical protein